jgi:serine/threonine protein kinase/tetratricopeptide (TPR) repeat protein
VNPLRPGELLAARYRIERLLGRGGMGAVFLATHLGLDKRVAVKVLDVSVENSPESLERFKREGRAAAAIGHPAVVEVLDTGTTDWGMPFLVMEYLEGPTLRAFFKVCGPFEPRVAVAIIVPMLDALAAAHEKGILHRDLKPSNVMLATTPRQQVKLLDFGISKFLRSVTVITRTGVALGTPMYMSPEQMVGEKELTGATDLYSVGAMLFELLAGRGPFLAGNELTLMHQVVNTDAPPLAATAANLPGALCRVVDRLLSRDPLKRPVSAEALKRELIAAVEPGTDLLWSQVERMAPASIPELVAEAQKATPSLSGPGPRTTDAAVPAMPAAPTLTLPKPAPRWAPHAIGAAVTFVLFLTLAVERSGAFSPTDSSAAPQSAKPVPQRPDPGPVLAEAEKELAQGNLARAKELYTQCVRDGQQCIESRRGLARVNLEAQNLELLARAERALSNHNEAEAGPLLNAARDTTAFKQRHSELSARASELARSRPQPDEPPLIAPANPNVAILASAEEALKRGDLAAAQEILQKCKVAGRPCPDARAKLEIVKAEKGFKVLLDKAERAIAAKDTEEATRLLGQAYNTQVFVERHQELEERLKELLSGREPSRRWPPPTRSSPIALAQGSSQSGEVERLIEESREHNKRNEYDKAKTKLLSCIKLEPNNALCHKLLGSTYALLKDSKRGISHYKKFIELAPDDPSAPKVKTIIDLYEQSQR